MQTFLKISQLETILWQCPWLCVWSKCSIYYTYLDWIKSWFDAASKAMASSEYIFKGELNCCETICFGVPPMLTVLICWLFWPKVGDIGDIGGEIGIWKLFEISLKIGINF